MYNCHIHTFNASYTPNDFFKLQVEKLPAWVAALLRNLINNKPAHYLLSKLLRIPDANVKKYVSFLFIGTMKTQDMIFESVSRDVYPHGTRIAVLPLNFEYMSDGKVNIPYHQQLDDLLEVRKRNPDTCLPFVFIDPRMGNADENLQFVAQYIKKGCVGIKLYPSLGYYPYDPRLEKVYAFAEEYGIPLLTHCSRGGIHYYGKHVQPEFLNPVSFNPQPGYDNNYTYKFEGDWKAFKNNFLQPKHWDQILMKYPKLKICLAHYGFDAANESPWNGKDNPWYNTIKGLIAKYENVYTDISYTLFDYSVMPLVMQDLTTPGTRLKERILFGTDYYMTVQEKNGQETQLFSDSKKYFGQVLFAQLSDTNCKTYITSKVWQY